MGASEIIDVINVCGIVISFFAAIYSIRIYFQAHYNAKSIRLSKVGWSNFAIFVSMIFIVITTFFASAAENTSLVFRLTLADISFIGLFTLLQTFYLLSSRSPIKQLSTQKQHKHALVSPEVPAPLQNEEPDVKLFRDYMRTDDAMNNLRIFDMSFPLATTEMYIPTRVYPEPLQLSAEQIEKLEEQFTPLDVLNEKLKILEKRNEGAIDFICIFDYDYPKHFVLLGDPGIGKTTLLKHLSICPPSIKKGGVTKKLLPIYISLNDYANHPKKELFEYVVDTYGDNLIELPKDKVRAIIKPKLEDGTALMLLDGLDETIIGNDASKTYEDVRNKIARFAGEYEDTFIIVTSRKASYELRTKLIDTGDNVHGREFKSLEMAGFLREDVRNFVKRWLNKISSHDGKVQKDEDAPNLLLKLEQDSRLRELSHNPLLLSIMTLAYTRSLNISHRRASLYDECVSALLKDWDKSRTIERTNEALLSIQNELPELKNDILKELAWHFHKLERNYFSKEDALTVIEKPLERKGIPFVLKEHILNEIIINSGLLKQDSEYSCSFSHITFQEYFAAKYMVDTVKSGGESTKEEEEAFINKWSDPWWEEVILLYAGLTSKPHYVLDNLVSPDEPDKDDIYYTNTIFAGRCIAATSAQSHEKAKKVIEKLYTILHDPAQRGLTNEVINLLHKHLANRVANTLIEIADENVNNKLLEMLENRNVSKIAHENIADALGTCSDQKVPEKLKDLLVNPANGQQLDNMLASHIAYTLGELGDQSVAEDLAKYLNRASLGGTLVDLHISIVHALRSLREPSVIPQLCEHFSNIKNDKKHTDEKIKIVNTLGVLGSILKKQETKGTTAPTAKKLKDTKDTLSQTLLGVIRKNKASEDVNYANVQYACIGTFGQWHDTSMIPELQKLRDTISSWPLRSRIAVILNILGDIPVEHDILSLLDKNVDEQARIALIQFIIDQQAKSLIPEEMMPLLFDDTTNFYVRSKLADAMETLGDKKVAERLLRSLTPDVRCKLAEAVGELGDEKVAERLLEHLTDKNLDPFVCSKMILALGTLCDSGKLEYGRLISALRAFLSNPNTDKEIIRSCTEVISKIGELNDRELARSLLRDIVQEAKRKDNLIPYLQSFTIILGLLDDKTVLDDLIKLLLKKNLANNEKDDKEERARVVKTLINLKDSSIVPELLDKPRDNTVPLEIRISIVKVIKHIAKDRETCKHLIEAMNQAKIPELKEKLYEAIWEISRRGQRIKVYQDNNTPSEILVGEMKEIEIDTPAMAGSQAK